MTVHMTVAQAEELLEARYSAVKHEESGYSTIGTCLRKFFSTNNDPYLRSTFHSL